MNKVSIEIILSNSYFATDGHGCTRIRIMYRGLFRLYANSENAKNNIKDKKLIV
jgi:hypothetical protein